MVYKECLVYPIIKRSQFTEEKEQSQAYLERHSCYFKDVNIIQLHSGPYSQPSAQIEARLMSEIETYPTINLVNTSLWQNTARESTLQ